MHTSQKDIGLAARRRTRRAILALLVAWLAITGPALGQGLPMLPSPITTDELMTYAERLDLAAQQRQALLPLHDAYLERFRTLRDGDMQDFEDDLIGLISRINPMDLHIPPRDELEGLLRQYNSLIGKVKQVDRTLFTDMQSILTEAQLLDLDRVRYAREISMYKEVTLGIAGEFNEGARADLSEYALELDLTPDVETQIDVILRSYESEMLKEVRDVHEEVEKGFVVILDTIDQLGLRNMSMEEMAKLEDDQDFIQTIMNIFNEASKPFQKAVSDVSELNLRTWRRIADVLPPKARHEMRDRYFHLAYRRAIQGLAEAMTYFRKALRLAELTDDQRGQLETERSEFERRSDVLIEETASLLERSRRYRTALQMDDDTSASGEYSDRINGLVERRRQLWDSTKARCEAILGPELVAIVEREEPLPDGQRIRTFQDESGQTITVVERDDEPDEADSDGVKRDPFLPLPIEVGRLDEIASALGLDAAQRPILRSLYDDYRAGYDKVFIEPAPEDGVSATPAENSDNRDELERAKKRQDRYQAIRDLDKAFFDQVALVTASEGAEAQLQPFRTARRLASARHCLEHWNRFARNRRESFVDLVELVAGLDLSGDEQAAIAPIVKTYTDKTAALLEESCRTAMEASRLDALVRVLSEQGSDKSDMIARREQEDNQSLEKNASTLARLNRDTVEQLKQALDEDAGWRIVQAYNEQVYPQIYGDRNEAQVSLDAALKFDDLSTEQREQLRLIAADYRRDYYALGDELVEIARGRENFQFRGVIPVDLIRGEIRGERLKFLRAEAGARARARLQILLDPEQARRLRAQVEDEDDDENNDAG